MNCRLARATMMKATRFRGTASAVAAALFLPACSGFIGDAYVNRRAQLVARVVTSDGHTGVPCKMTALLLGDEGGQAEVASGSEATLEIGMVTPAKVESPVKTRRTSGGL